ncbi:MAG: hypothetical protein V1793_15145 [Pseudomonadota bacterium]
MSSLNAPTKFYLFDLDNGKKKLAWGQSPGEALKILSYRLNQEEMAQINVKRFKVIKQRNLQDVKGQLG